MATLLFGSIFSYLLISRLLLGLVEVTGESMSPSLRSGDFYLLHKYPYLWSDPAPGEIVALCDPLDDELSVKRVIALPGDRIGISNGVVEVNGALLEEPYLREAGTTYTVNGQPYHSILEVDQYFLMGDNRRNSVDARSYGPVSRRRIRGVIRRP